MFCHVSAMCLAMCFAMCFALFFSKFLDRSRPVRDPFGIRSGSVRANFGLKFPKPKISKFMICAAVAAAAGAL